GLTGKKARLRSKVRDLSGLISAAEAEGEIATAPEETAEVAAEVVAPEAAPEAAAEEDAKKDGE
ncbi:MAG: hypothetical protein JRG90_09200, partial [Deltaproteobacteria bacterium]|nr:hypothetical protein [Deltaproteobacteria bacterium]